MENGVQMVAKLYGKDVYKKEPTIAYQIPCDTNISGFDRYPMSETDHERVILMKGAFDSDPELAQEFRQLMRHHRSSLLRDEFVKCANSNCAMCSEKQLSRKEGQLDTLLKKFPKGMLPTPMPVLLPLPTSKDSSARESADDQVPTCSQGQPTVETSDVGVPSDDESGAPVRVQTSNRKPGRYRSFGELLKMKVNPGVCYPDAFYEGGTKLLRCSICVAPFEVFKSKTALDRHRKLHHIM